MTNQSFKSGADAWSDLSPTRGLDRIGYSVRVRNSHNEIYLWGSAGITQASNLPANLVLHIRNDELGETVAIGTTTSGNVATTLGTLQPGECYSLSLQNLTGVFASCELDSIISCSLRHA